MAVAFYYEYRDGDNYRNGSAVVLANPDNLDLAAAEAAIKAACEDEENFIAHQVGLAEIFSWNPAADYDPNDEATFPPDLGPGKYVINDADHCWHSFNGLHETAHHPTEAMTLKELVERFQKANKDGWKLFSPGHERP